MPAGTATLAKIIPALIGGLAKGGLEQLTKEKSPAELQIEHKKDITTDPLQETLGQTLATRAPNLSVSAAKRPVLRRF